ncbi:MAG TPA: glycosyltransferase, partial [Chloroflexota bacterium]|nr:glycosyltransferase [Chloroflexota bacterium]
MVFLRAAFQNVDLAIAPSKFLMQMFSRNGYETKRILYSPHGLDTSWMTQTCTRDSGSTLCIGYVGQIDPIKGVDVLVRAFQLIPAQMPVELRVYGDLSKNPRFTEALLQISAGSPKIKFMGPFERSELGRVLSLIDVVAVPSVWYENTPLAIAEAFAAGKPVIA